MFISANKKKISTMGAKSWKRWPQHFIESLFLEVLYFRSCGGFVFFFLRRRYAENAFSVVNSSLCQCEDWWNALGLYFYDAVTILFI